MKKTGEDYPCGPCGLPVICSKCGTVITKENAIYEHCEKECEICDYCGCNKCPNCHCHCHCGGCI